MSVPQLEIPTGQELYDKIMGEIEPDLTSAGKKTLAEKYKDETPEQRALRKVRYQQALARYDEAYEGYMRTLKAQVERHRHQQFQDVEAKDRRQEADWMKQFDSLTKAT